MIILITPLLFSAVIGNGYLTVYTLIAEGAVNFSVTQTLLEANAVNLLTETAVAPSGEGIKIGGWGFSGTTQANSVDYTVTYSYNVLTNGSTEVEYILVESDGVTPVDKISGATTTFTAPAGNSALSREVLFRLTSTGLTTATSAPAGNFQDTITITLTNNN